jgi:hypothetical protein
MKNLLKDLCICGRIILNMTLDKRGEKWYTHIQHHEDTIILKLVIKHNPHGRRELG